MQINKVCILGGGTSGFFVSSLLEKYREISKINFKIVQVHNPKMEKIGVGESTLLQINDFFSYLDLKDEDWMKECDATYKTSIRFEDFYKLGTHFHYPFGKIYQRDPNYGQLWFTLKDKYPDIFTQDTIARYLIPSAYLNEENKLTEKCEELLFNLNSQSAYHFDSHKLANFLEKRLRNKDVNIIEDEYISSIRDKDGNIKSIICKDSIVDADLFIDCSGFKSLLLGKELNEKYIDFNDTLINNRVVRTKFPYKNKDTQLKNYTNCIALRNGWCWEIPLWNGISVGYVHSTKFETEDEILEEFKNHCKKYQDEFNVDYKIINYKTGRYERGWVNNVVAVGLSYGFLEPLESTGIASLLVNCFRLIEVLSKRDMFISNVDKDVFNYAVGAGNLDVLKNFIEMHYYLSSRTDSDYWKHVTQKINYDSENLDSEYRKFLHKTVIMRDYIGNECETGYPFIIGGMNYSPYSKAYVLKEEHNKFLEDRKNLFLEEEIEIDKLMSNIPSTYEFLSEKIYNHDHFDFINN